ncbi:hypothetical protein Tco_0597511 [Tanacetum coccineum]
MVGALMYLTASRPDIVHATCYCARYQAKPTEKHLTAVKRIFRFDHGAVLIHVRDNQVAYNLLGGDKCKAGHPKSWDSLHVFSRIAEFKYLVKRLGMRCLTPDELEVLSIESA